MDIINSSVLSLILIAVLSTVLCETLGHGSMFSALKTVCSLCVLLALFNALSPLFNVVDKITDSVPPSDNNSENNVNFDDIIITETKETIEKYVTHMISSRFNVETDDVIVTLSIDKQDVNNVKITEVTVKFLTEPNCPANIISEVLTNELMCKVIILLPS